MLEKQPCTQTNTLSPSLTTMETSKENPSKNPRKGLTSHASALGSFPEKENAERNESGAPRTLESIGNTCVPICGAGGRLAAVLRYSTTEYAKARVRANAERERRIQSVSVRARYRRSEDFRIRQAWRREIVRVIHAKRISPKRKTSLGCSLAEFRQHIEAQFRHGMTWENYATVWEIDHVVPVFRFKSHEMASCFHYTNLRPRLEVMNKIDGILAIRKRRSWVDIIADQS